MNDLIIKLERLGIINSSRLESYYPRVRDREDVAVLRDPITEVIVLSRSDHLSGVYYKNRKEQVGCDIHGTVMMSPSVADNRRRSSLFAGFVRGKRWLDFGCGLGGMLDELSGEAEFAAGLELNEDRIAIVKSKGHQVLSSLDEIENDSFDIVTMFHVLEHLGDPDGILKSLSRVLIPGGRLLVEVPHARDALFTLYDCEAFKRFTFWSEHLVLHTRQSLALLLGSAGFSGDQIMSFQRYPLANHLYWLARGLPGGHEVWSALNSAELESSYLSVLSKIDRSDTLIALAILK